MSENKDTRTATQKIEDLEKVVTVLYEAVAQSKPVLDGLLKTQASTVTDLNTVKEIVKILNRKADGIVQIANPETGITMTALAAQVSKVVVEEMTAQVAGFVSNGQIVPADVVGPNTYLITEELNPADNAVVIPRVQFRLDSQDDALQTALTGKKVGDVVSPGENKFSLKILEIYTLVEQKEGEASPSETAPAATETPVSTTPLPPAQAANVEVPPTPTGPSNDALGLPAESPVTEFVPSQPDTTATA